MRMCGIATAARAAADEIAGTGARILDTRKTAPGLRQLDKYAVAVGGAVKLGWSEWLDQKTGLAWASTALTLVAAAFVIVVFVRVSSKRRAD